MLSHYMSGLLPKVAYFTEVESNKVNEETLIQLAPEIFTCLRFEELGKIVIQNAKEILDADRCSLFVADHAERMLFNWQSDISGRGGVEVFEDIKKTGMAIPFGHGIVGMVAETCEVINIPDAYEDPRFNSSWDKKTQYRTKSILTVPILTTTAKKQSVRRRRSQQDLYSGAIVVDRAVNAFKASSITDDREDTGSQEGQNLLGVVQVINKSGGAPFRSKDEFLLQTISKLMALAIENSQLFQKNQELCVDLGKLIADADLVEAIASLGASAEDIIGVERAAIYVLEPNSTDLYTFHRKRRHKIVLKEHMYRHSLLQQAIETQELVVVNDLSSSYYSSMYNAYVDSIGGLAVRNVLFAPLVIDDPDDTTTFPGITSFAASTKSLKTTNGSGVLPGKKLIGVLHLVNTRGRKLMFERHDLFLSIVSAQTCSVIASILEKQAMLEQKEQTQHLLDTTLSFFKEMSPVGIINAVYNTCSSILNVEKAHLFLWEPDHRHMWTAKLSPNAESVSAAVHSTKPLSASSSGLGSSSSAIPSLRSQARRISVLTDQRIRVPTTEGLLEHVLSKSSLVVVKQWVDIIQEGEGNDDSELPSFELDRPVSSFQHSFEVSKYVFRACRSDYKAGFTSHSVVACPVWDIYGLEVVGVLVLLFPRGRAPRPSELSNLPILSRQISGALNVCGEMSSVTRRSRELQDMVEWSPRRTQHAMSLTLSARGHLVAFSQPINIGTSNFSAAALQQFVQTNSSARHSIEPSRLPMDDAGHRWVFLLSGASVHEMSNDHYVNWLGRDVATYVSSNCTDEIQPPSSLPWFDKFRTDLQSVYVRKEIVHGVLHLVGGKEPTTVVKTSEYTLPIPVQLAIRRFLWEFTDARWKIDMKRACKVFDVVDPSHTRCVSRRHLEYVLTTQGRNVSLDQMEWDLLHAQFADPDTDLINVERMFTSLMPRFQLIRQIGYELVPVLDSITQSVISVHVLLTAQNM
ncbi:hypothetical protein Poli38472_004422 [Pythium oligandrum]|uniref:GAF domain-containing protein n=1 Tax=Pythium oligandrum TaxID=41045 RepID=A0A8K1FI36_PYTOL|nr:hypothetical protein Poli38472_004422 [Pythium oligandrum]|eukprot:TMW59353.1 hypothetical protein Poli38472_004422 [Pythium oligandrum]